MGTIAYLRISTGGQDFNTQRFTILDYAQQHGLVIDTFVESQSSSRRTIGERGLRAVLDQLHTGDTLLVVNCRGWDGASGRLFSFSTSYSSKK